MKTRGRRRSTNIIDLRGSGSARAAPKGPRLKKSEPMKVQELPSLSEMNSTLSIQAHAYRRRREQFQKTRKKIDDAVDDIRRRQKKPKG